MIHAHLSHISTPPSPSGSPQVVLATDMKQHFSTIKVFTEKVVPLTAAAAASSLTAMPHGKGKALAKSVLPPTLVSYRSLDGGSGGRVSRPSPSSNLISNLTRTRSIDTLASAAAASARHHLPCGNSHAMLPTLSSSNAEPPAVSHTAALVDAAAITTGALHLRASPAKAAAALGASLAVGAANASSCDLPHLTLEEEHCLLLWKVRG